MLEWMDEPMDLQYSLPSTCSVGFSKIIFLYRWAINSGVEVLLRNPLLKFTFQDESPYEQSATGCSSNESLQLRDDMNSNMACEYSQAQCMLLGTPEPATPPQTLELEKCYIYQAFLPHSREMDLDNTFDETHPCPFRDFPSMNSRLKSKSKVWH